MININTKKTKVALAEVYDIIQHSAKEVKEKIPANFMQFLKNNMSQEKVNIDYRISIMEQQNLQPETKVILGIIYRDFLCDQGKKEVLLLKEKKELAESEIKKREQYNVDNLFKKEEIKPVKNMELIVYQEEKWYSKIWNKLKNIFKK